MTDPVSAELEVPRRAISVAEALLVIGCIYEADSLLRRRTPPVTRIIKIIGRLHLGPMPAGRLAVWAWCGFIAWHFLEPDD